MQKSPMTARGFHLLKAELNHLKTVERPAVIKSIASARDLGDLSENAEYHAAREKQGFIEGRIAELEALMAQAEVIDITSLSGDTVRFGATVTIVDEETDEEKVYMIVGEHEADLSLKLISNTSPLAKGLMGKKVGASVEVETPAGRRGYEILDVKFVEPAL